MRNVNMHIHSHVSFHAEDWSPSRIAEACAPELAAADADLLVLEGMGRGVETNYDAVFSIDTLRICLVMNKSVAQRIGGENFDCVCMLEKLACCGLDWTATI